MQAAYLQKLGKNIKETIEEKNEETKLKGESKDDQKG
jgi:hypothetical protein